MKKNLLTIGIVVLIIILAIISVLTVVKIKQLGTSSVAPNVPQSKPAAVETLPANLTPAPGCKVNTAVATLTPTPTPTGTLAPTPTPTSTSSPTPTLTTTPAPTNTPTPILGKSGCDYLRADVVSGNSPLSVGFSGKGHDTKQVKGFRFTFGDGEKEEVFGSFTNAHIQKIAHTYTESGEFKAILEILDNGDHWRTQEECTETIIVSGTTKRLTPTPTRQTFRDLEPTPTLTGKVISPTPTKIAVVSTGVPTKIPTPTEMELPKAGLKIPTLGGIFAGFLLMSIGLALIL